MIKRVVFALMLICVASTLSSIEKRVEPFDRVAISVSADVFISQADVSRVVLNGNLAKHVRVKVRGGELKVYKKPFFFLRTMFLFNQKLDVYVYTQQIRAIQISGSSEVSSTDVLTGEEFSLFVSGSASTNLKIDVDRVRINISGSADVELDVKADELFTKVSGSTDLKYYGQVEKAEYKISGSADVKAFDLQSVQTRIDASGSADIEVNVAESLDIDISGSVDLQYKGDGKIGRIETSGSANIDKVD